MKESKERSPTATRGVTSRSAKSSVSIAVALIAVVGIVGAVNYVVLNAIGVDHTAVTTTTNSTTSCHPSTAPECRTDGTSSSADLIQLAPAGAIA